MKLELGSAYLGAFGSNFEKTIVIFEIRTLKFPLLQDFVQKINFLNWEPKIPDFRILILEFEDNIVIFQIGTLGFVYWQNFAKKSKVPKSRTKNTLFEKLLSYLDQHLLNYPSTKFCEETKMLKFGSRNPLFWVYLTKNALFGYF